MSLIVNSPQVVRRIEDNLEYIMVDTWKRKLRDQWFKRIVKTRSQKTKREIVQWLIETAKIRPLGNGGNINYEDLAETSHEFTVDRFGEALRLTTDEIEDGAAIDRAGAWARQMSSNAVMWPQKVAGVDLVKAGKVKGSYDGVPFWSLAHPIHPLQPSGATFPNLFYDMPFSPENLALAYEYVATIKGPDGEYRKLRPTIVAAGEKERLRVVQALGASFYADPVRSGTTAPAENMIKASYGFAEPLIAAEFDETRSAYYNTTTGAYQGATSAGGALQTRGVWYLFCELEEDAELGALIYSESKPFELTTYSHLDDVQLAQMDEYEWMFKGRNGAQYGHPFLGFRFEPGPAP